MLLCVPQVLLSSCESFRAAAVPVHIDLTHMASAADMQAAAAAGSQGGAHPRLQELQK